MQNITDSEFQREVEALKSHRRLSVHRPVLDPDLPEIITGQTIPRDEHSSTSPSSPGASGTPLSRGWNPKDGVSLSDDAPSSTFTGTLVRRNGSSSARSTFTARRRGLNNSISKHDGRLETSSVSADSPLSTANDGSSSQKPLDPSHLFWVPASVHPEISPSDFRRFLHDHASRAVREQEGAEEGVGVTKAGQISPTSPTGLASQHPVEVLKQRSTSIARRGSTLRKQYRPEMDVDNEGSTQQESQSPSRSVSQRRGQQGGAPQLSIEDLQRLEQLAEEASRSSDPSELRSVLRRTMSLSMASSALDQVDALPVEGDQDAPLIVPKPGQILRRAARTKIRKSSFSADGFAQSGEGGGGSGRRRRAGAGVSMDDTVKDGDNVQNRKRTSDGSDPSEDGSDATAALRLTNHVVAPDGPSDVQSRDSYTSEDTQRTSVTSLAESDKGSALTSRPDTDTLGAYEPATPTQSNIVGEGHAPTVATTAEPVSYFAETGYGQGNQAFVKHEQAQMKDATVSADSTPIPSVLALSESQASAPTFESTRPAPLPPSTSALSEVKPMPTAATDSIVPSVSAQRISRSDTMPNLNVQTSGLKAGKEKKGGFGLQWLSNWAKDDDSNEKLSKKERKEKKDREKDVPPHGQGSLVAEKEKESSGFLGALFGKRKTQDDSPRHDYSINTPSAAAVTAGSLLDMRARDGGDWTHYNRYPIHIERAVYRLSHIKLANPRRPLYEQVLISNLMFWYLSVINQTQQMQQQQQYQTQQQQQQQQRRLQQQQQQQQQSPLQPQAQPNAVYSTSDGAPRIAEDVPAPSANPFDEAMEPHLAMGTAIASADLSEQQADMVVRTSRVDGESESGARTYDGQVPVGSDFAEKNLDRGPEAGSAERVEYANTSVSSERELPSNGRQSGQPIGAGSGINRVGSPPLQKSRKSGLVKPNRAPPGSRSAERAIPAAAYGAQHRQINSEIAHSAAVAAAHAGDAQSSDRTRISPNLTSVRYTGRNPQPAQATLNADEHAWLGSQRRSPNAEDRRSDPLNDISAGHSTNWRDFENVRKGVNRISEPSQRGLSGSNGKAFYDEEGQLPGTIEPSINGSAEIVDGWTRQPIQDSEGEGILLSSSKEASAMLDAARQSRSRRR